VAAAMIFTMPIKSPGCTVNEKQYFMWQGHDKVWLHYVKDIIAADVYSAVFLASYLRYISLDRSYISHLEAIDLQRYKVHKKAAKVRNALKECATTPFIFIVGKN